MAGNRSSENGDFVTPRKVYRSEVSPADTDDPASGAVPILDTRFKDQNYGQTTMSFYGRNAQIDAAVFLRRGASAATLKLYLLADVELQEAKPAAEAPSSSSSSSSSSGGGETEWVLVETKSVSANVLWVIQNIPPGRYKILVTSITGNGEVEIRTQHAA
jgi:hypothetical protein